MSSSDDEPLSKRVASTTPTRSKPKVSYTETSEPDESDDDVPLSSKKKKKQQTTATKSAPSKKSTAAATTKPASKPSASTKSAASKPSSKSAAGDADKENTKKTYDKPGQRRDTPDELDPFRMFYESLYHETLFNTAMYTYKQTGKVGKHADAETEQKVKRDAFMYSVADDKLIHTSQDKWKYKSVCVRRSEMSEKFMLLHGLFDADTAIQLINNKTITSPVKRPNPSATVKRELSSSKGSAVKREPIVKKKQEPAARKRLAADSSDDDVPLKTKVKKEQPSSANSSAVKVKSEPKAAGKAAESGSDDEPLQKKVKREPKSQQRTAAEVKAMWAAADESSDEDVPLINKLKK